MLVGPGWGVPRDTDENSPTLAGFGTIGLGPLRAAGYNVLTWDPRGFGQSGGTVEVDSPDYEAPRRLGADRLRRPAARGAARQGRRPARRHGRRQLRRRHPARDRGDRPARRRDHARHRLELAGHQPLQGAVAQGRLEQPPVRARRGFVDRARASPAGRDRQPRPAHRERLRVRRSRPARSPTRTCSWFASRGPGALVDQIKRPTLLIQGTADTLFTLDEAIRNYGDPAQATACRRKMLWFCGGHGACLTSSGPSRLRRGRDHQLVRALPQAGQALGRHGPALRVDRRRRPGRAPAATTRCRSKRTRRRHRARHARVHARRGQLGHRDRRRRPATNAVRVPIPAPAAGSQIVGAPKLTLTYSGLANQHLGAALRADRRQAAQPRGRQHGHADPGRARRRAAHAHASRSRTSPRASRRALRTSSQILPYTAVYGPQRAAGAITMRRIDISLPVVNAG